MAICIIGRTSYPQQYGSNSLVQSLYFIDSMQKIMSVLSVVFSVTAIVYVGIALLNLDTEEPPPEVQAAALPRAPSENCVAAPPLPEVERDNGAIRVLDIDSVEALHEAMNDLRANTVLLLEPGRYDLKKTLSVEVDK